MRMQRSKLVQWSVNGCALFMLGALPLLFHDAYFDINRIKVFAVSGIPLLAAFVLIFIPNRKKRIALSIKTKSTMGLLALLISACLSYCMSGFQSAVLTGSAGRYCGLLFLAACASAYFLISSRSTQTEGILGIALACAALVALLGIIQAAGLDPLRFYTRILPGTEHHFLSTIGNVDFYGAYLAMLFPFMLGVYVFSGSRLIRLLCIFGSTILLFGALVARADVPFAAIQMGCVVITLLSAGIKAQLCRSMAVWAVSWCMLPAVQAYLLRSRFGLTFSGVLFTLCSSHAAPLMGIALLFLAMFISCIPEKVYRVPERKRLLCGLGLFLLLVICLLLAAGVICTYVLPEGAAVPSLLRFNDQWGSRRGFVYRCSTLALADYTPLELLFGKGLDLTRNILTPYFDDPQMLASGVFNDAHCQPLQFLLTCGILGLLSFIAFYICSFRSVLVYAGQDPLLCGAAAFLAAYGVIMLLSVTQPIVIATYFSLCAITRSRIRTMHAKEVSDES